MAATVTMELSEYQELHHQKQAVELENARLKQQITEVRVASSDQHLLALGRAAIDIVRYAVANLPPESNAGWPFESLRAVAEEIVHMPDAGATHEELSMTFKSFATECEENELRRKLRREVKQADAPSLADLAQRSQIEAVDTRTK